MNIVGRILRVEPGAAIPGGEVVIECAGFELDRARSCEALFQGTSARLIGANKRRVLAIVPEGLPGGEININLSNGETQTEQGTVIIGRMLADELHPVANPAFDPDDGALFVTRSGSRGQQLPVTLFRIDADDELTDFSGDITNPTGIAFDQSGQMFVTSRMDGTVYRITPFKEAIAFATDLGVATGLAFDSEGQLYVGDRTGTIYRVNSVGEETAWAQLEPSVSAYHLAFGPDGALYVTGPTVSSFESVMRIDRSGEVSVFYHGLGRPQGIAFDRDGNLYVAASLRGQRGIVRLSPDASEAQIVVAGMNVVGLAFSPKGEMVVATTDAVYSLPLGIHGTLL